jgi:hypothetical protein
VFKVTDRRNSDFQIVKSYIADILEWEKRQERIAAYNSTLKAQYRLTCHVDALHLLLERGVNDSLMVDSERTMELFTWSGGRLSVEDYLDRVGSGLPSVMDSAAVRASGEKLAVRRIALIEAHKKGYDKEKRTLSQVRRKRNELIAEHLHRVEAVEKASVTEADLRAYYEEHQDEFRVPAAVMLQELLVKTEEEAKRLIEQIQNGADMGALARQHSLRSGTRERGGKTGAVTRDNPQFGPVAQQAFDAPIGVIQGPVQVPTGFSIFKVSDRREERMRSFEEVRRTLEAVVRTNAQNEAMDRFLESLKEKYGVRIKVYEKALKLTLCVKRET